MNKAVFQKTLIPALACVAAMLASCSRNPEEEGAITVVLNQIAVGYDAQGVWTGAMSSTDVIDFYGVTFAHAGMPEWNTWNGFVASRNSDTADYTSGNWLEHQFTAITGGGMSGVATPYMVAYWNSGEVLENVLTTDKPSCLVQYAGGNVFKPLSVFVTNTTYSYCAMKNGTQWSKKFSKGDYCKLLAYGITVDDTVTAPVEMFLAKYETDGDLPVSQWVYFNLESLGRVKAVFFRMESSDTGKWGMSNPAYFAIDRMSIMPM